MDKSVVQGSQQAASPVNIWRATISAFCTSLVGIGLSRFAYTPLLPAIINAHWFAPSAAAYLGAANFAGYLGGALLGRQLAARMPVAIALRLMMVLATLAFFGCAFPLSFLWFFVWRFAAGLSGGVLMVLAAPTILPHIPPQRRGLVGGIIFMSVGVGIIASGTLVPFLLHQGLTQTWLGLGALSLLATIVAWGGWPAEAPRAKSDAPRARPQKLGTLRALYAEYALNAAGLVPHMIFLVDYISRGLGQGLQTGAEYWVLFGLGATVGPLLTGHLADRAGFGPALRLAYFLQAGAVVLPALGLGPISLVISSVVVGAFTPGIVPLVLGRLHELLADHQAEQKSAWSTATVSFAILQATGAYGLSFVFAQSGGNYHLLFAIGTVALLAALAIDLAAAVLTRRAD